MKTAEEVMKRVIDELSHTARTAEDRTRLESVQQRWRSIRADREQVQLKILLLVEELKREDEQFAALDE